MLNDQIILSNDAAFHCIVFVLLLAPVSKNSVNILEQIPVFSHRCGSHRLAAASLHYSDSDSHNMLELCVFFSFVSQIRGRITAPTIQADYELLGQSNSCSSDYTAGVIICSH